jgi:hypothetical protein
MVRMTRLHRRKKEGIKLVLSCKLVFRGVLPSVLDFPFLCIQFFPFCSLCSYVSKLRMKHRVKLGHKDRVTLKITPSCYAFGIVGKPATRWCARF